MTDEDRRDEAVPAIHAGTDADHGRLLSTLQVDGETFTVRSRGDSIDYDWISGPNKGYGFSTTGGTEDSREAHEESIRAFLGMIDPATGYIAED